jgi:macrodomain Ter protein organizer (MatP/YcbG family)
MNERRQQPRRRPSARYEVLNRLTDELLGTLMDVSAEGIQLAGYSPAHVNTEYSCTMRLPYEIAGRRRVRFEARCQWCRKSKVPGVWTTGYKLTNVAPRERDILREVINRVLIEQNKSNTTTVVKAAT